MAKTELENKLQRRCQQTIKDGGAFVFKTHGNMFTRTGIPDLVACVPVTVEVLLKMIEDGWFKNREPGIFVGLEIKRENRISDTSEAQEIVGEEIRDAGGIWFAVDDNDLVQAIIKTMRGEM